MARSGSIRKELDQLRADVEALRAAQRAKPQPEPPPAGDDKDEARTFEEQFRHLTELAQDMLADADEMFNDAEDKIASHPVISIAAALSLGFIIGRFTPR